MALLALKSPALVTVSYHVVTLIISSSRLRKIISWYHIILDFAYKLPYSDEFISTHGPLEVAFYEEAFMARLRICYILPLLGSCRNAVLFLYRFIQMLGGPLLAI